MPYKDRQAHRDATTNRVRERKAVWFLANGPCRECGSWDQLELDHITRDEKEDHRVWGWSDERRIVELAKCQVLCQSCHRTKTNRELSEAFSQPIKHGALSAYDKKGCRCDLCKAVKSTYQRNHRGIRGRFSNASVV
jgi:5-methylcytosine-specific restriction endonuclease McrA